MRRTISTINAPNKTRSMVSRICLCISNLCHLHHLHHQIKRLRYTTRKRVKGPYVYACARTRTRAHGGEWEPILMVQWCSRRNYLVGKTLRCTI
jgi:hypothetical protein